MTAKQTARRYQMRFWIWPNGLRLSTKSATELSILVAMLNRFSSDYSGTSCHMNGILHRHASALCVKIFRRWLCVIRNTRERNISKIRSDHTSRHTVISRMYDSSYERCRRFLLLCCSYTARKVLLLDTVSQNRALAS